MLLPLRTDRPHHRLPAANYGLIAAILAMYAVQLTVPGVESALLLRPLEPGLLGFVGSGFLHGGVLHLVGNLVFLYIFGNDVDDTLGHPGYLAFFLGGVVFSGLVHSAVEDNPALGASGGVSAVTGIYLALYPKSRVVLVFWYLVLTTITVPAVWFIGITFAIDLFGGLDSLLLGNDSGVARWAHIGGGVFGFAVGYLLVKAKLLRPSRETAFALLAKGRERRRDLAERKRTGQTHESAMDILPKSQADPIAARAQELKGELRDHLDAKQVGEAALKYVELVALDGRQILPPADQMTVAEQLYREGQHASAAEAFERYLGRYARPGDVESAQARLMLGLLLGRYLDRPAEARRELTTAAEELDQIGDDKHAAFARDELGRLPPGG